MSEEVEVIDPVVTIVTDDGGRFPLKASHAVHMNVVSDLLDTVTDNEHDIPVHHISTKIMNIVCAYLAEYVKHPNIHMSAVKEEERERKANWHRECDKVRQEAKSRWETNCKVNKDEAEKACKEYKEEPFIEPPMPGLPKPPILVFEDWEMAMIPQSEDDIVELELGANAIEFKRLADATLHHLSVSTGVADMPPSEIKKMIQDDVEHEHNPKTPKKSRGGE